MVVLNDCPRVRSVTLSQQLGRRGHRSTPGPLLYVAQSHTAFPGLQPPFAHSGYLISHLQNRFQPNSEESYVQEFYILESYVLVHSYILSFI